ncbi:hypothetical protein DSO57_1005954 [Entomophthora muscae]|uniref:Uncharacterized protein n=1 Tax=Entomophthora muscae TaxID=34485 RepID=A0ACC2TVC8_9FUNG|nr:hypothetical protein DSO57_1005954 [Entomophthora muscae]
MELHGNPPGERSNPKKNNRNPTKAGQWGPFKDWTPDEATKWMSGGFKATEMKYWKRVKVSLKQAGEWTKVGITPEIHTTMDDNPITIDQ